MVDFEETIRASVRTAMDNAVATYQTKSAQRVTQEAIGLLIQTEALRGSGQFMGTIIQETEMRWQAASSEVRTRNLTVDYKNQEELSRVCVSDNASCVDCLILHGEQKTMGQWIDSGLLPGAGGTLCMGNCRCVLVPVSKADASLKDPISLSGGKTKPRDEAITQILNRPSTDRANVIARAKAAGVDISHL